MDRGSTKRQGFALIVVLSTLSLIALLFAIAGSRAVNRLAEVRTDGIVAQDAHARASLLALAAQVYGAADTPLAPDTPLPVTWRGEDAQLVLQDAGGLVDLNTANPLILERLAKAFDVTPAQLEDYRIWRRSPLRLQRVSDFARVVDGNAALSESLFPITTVYSGRIGIAAELAPIELLEALVGNFANRSALIQDLPANWVTPASGVTYHVGLVYKGKTVGQLGAISLRSPGNGLVLGSF